MSAFDGPTGPLHAKIYGAELGAKIHGTELMPRPRHASSYVNDTQKMTLDLGVWRRDM